MSKWAFDFLHWKKFIGRDYVVRFWFISTEGGLSDNRFI
jgi:hypothetical protein